MNCRSLGMVFVRADALESLNVKKSDREDPGNIEVHVTLLSTVGKYMCKVFCKVLNTIDWYIVWIKKWK